MTDAAYRERRLDALHRITRRHFLKTAAAGFGGLALPTLAGCRNADSSSRSTSDDIRGLHFAPRAKRVIFLHMAGAPSQLELFDYKPELHRLHGQLCPESLLEGKFFPFIKGTPKMLGPQATFAQYGESGAWVSDMLPHFAKAADEVTFLKAMHTDEFNHAPAQLLLHTGHAARDGPAWGPGPSTDSARKTRTCRASSCCCPAANNPTPGGSVFGSGFLPTVYEGVQCRSHGDPVLYVGNPKGMSRALRQKSIETINAINQRDYEETGDPETLSRMAQYEMAFRMQMSVPEAMDIEQEPQWVHDLYGTKPGAVSYANNCLLARRLVERGVRFVQLFHWGWDAHGASAAEALNIGFKDRCDETDRATTALLLDLKQRGLLEDTLLVWGGEFGRTPMLENRTGDDNPFVGRDHHTDTYTMWVAGGGVKRGFTFGETDEIGYSAVKDRVHIHDLQATILHLLGMNHERLIYEHQGRDFRLTDVHGQVVRQIMA